MLAYLLGLFVLIQPQTQTTLPSYGDAIREALSRAESLYYLAKFHDSIELLGRIEEVLRTAPEHLQEKISIKLQLALAYVGLNDNDHAKSALRELYALDKNYSLDPQLFAPKIITLFNEIKAEDTADRCQTTRNDMLKDLDAGNISTAHRSMEFIRSNCRDLAGIETSVADLLYKKGLENVRREEYTDALRNLEEALKFSPKHEMASQYSELVRAKLKVETDRLVLEWQKSFEARQFIPAATTYRTLTALDEVTHLNATERIKTAYRNALSTLVRASNEACAKGDSTAVTTIRSQISEIVSEPSLGQGILTEMTPCTTKACVQVSGQLALLQLKSRVEPEVSPAARRAIGELQVLVKVRIDENGDVSVKEVESSSPLVSLPFHDAVEKWKFTPAIDATGRTRCVETELPVMLKR